MEFSQLLEDVRARITVNKKNRTQIFEMMHEENIRKEVRIFLEPMKEKLIKKAHSFGLKMTEEELWKYTIIKSDIVEWDDYINALHNLFPDGLFHSFSFEDAAFMLFLYHRKSSFFLPNIFTSLFKKLRKKYV